MDKIDSIVRISGGVLQNFPSVKSVEHIRISATKVKRGDFFIDINSSSEEIETAVKSGAYCILTESLSKITDEEIAWIVVDNLEKSMVKLARFYAVCKNFRFIPLLNIQYALAKSLHIEQRVKLLSNSPAEALMQIVKSEDKTLFFVVQNSFIEKIEPTIKELALKIEPEQVFENGIFCSSFIYKGRYIKESRLSSFFVPYLCSLMEYLDDLKIEFRVESFSGFEHFSPQFVTSKLEKSDFGKTRKAIIFESDFELFEEELVYLKKRVDRKLLFSFTCRNEAIEQLPKIEFRYALLLGSIDEFSELIKDKNTVQMELFSDSYR